MKTFSSLLIIVSIIKGCLAAACSSAETLAKVKTIQSINIVNGAPDHVIPKSTLDSWFTVTNNAGDPSCGVQTHYICENLKSVSGSVCTSFTVDRTNGNSVLDPAAQINSNGDWVVATSSYTFTTNSIILSHERNAIYHIQSELPGGTVKALQVDLNLVSCSDSSATVGIIPSTRDSAITGSTTITEVGDTTGIQFKTYTTGYDLLGAFAGATDPIGCPVTSLALYYSSMGSYEPWNEPSKIRLSASNQLEVNIRDAYFPLIPIYVVGVTSAGKNGINNPHPTHGQGMVQFLIEVTCSIVSFQETAGVQTIQYLKQTGQASLNATEFQNYFALDKGNSPSNCTSLTYKVCSDKLNCESTLANNSDALNYFDGTTLLTQLSEDQTNNTLYIQATTVTYQTAYKQLSITVSCGQETVTSSSSPVASPQELLYQMDSSSISQYQVIDTKFLGSFSTSTNYCPITEVRLFQDQGGVISQYSDTTKIRINNNQLEINIRDNLFAVSDLPKIYIAGVTAAGRNSLQHFTSSLYGIEVQASVKCGRETIALSQNNVESINRLLKTEIEQLVLQPYFVVSLNGAHQTCANLTYEAQESGKVLAAPDDFAYVSSGQSTLTLNKAISQSARTITIRAKTVGNQYVDKSLSFTIQCGTEQIDLKTSTLNSKVTGNKVIVETINTQAVNQYKTLTSGSGYDLIGSFSDASDSDLCKVTDIVLYKDEGIGKTQWTDTNKIRINDKLLEINVKDSTFTQQTIYVVGITASGRNGLTNTNSIGYFMLKIQVDFPCGQEILSSTITNPNFALQLTKSVTTINVNQLFKVDLNGQINQNCQNLTLIACKDSTCNQEYQVGDMVHIDSNSLKIDTTSSFSKKVVYLNVTTYGSVTLTKGISLETCGTETIEVNSTKSQLQVILEKKESNEFYYVPQFIPIQSFTVGDSICNISQVVIYEKNGEKYEKLDLSNGNIKFGDGYQTLMINRNQELNKTLYITGVTSSGRNGINNPGIKKGIIELYVKISNPQIKILNFTKADKSEQVPEFESDPPSEIVCSIELNQTTNICSTKLPKLKTNDSSSVEFLILEETSFVSIKDGELLVDTALASNTSITLQLKSSNGLNTNYKIMIVIAGKLYESTVNKVQEMGQSNDALQNQQSPQEIPQSNQIEGKFDLQNKKEEEQKPLSYKVNISPKSELKIQFNQKLKKTFKRQMASRYLISEKDLFRLTYVPDDPELAVKFSYQLSETGDDYFLIKCNFSQPLKVSTGDYFDRIVVEINQKQFLNLYQSSDGNPLVIPENLKELKKVATVPTQHPVRQELIEQFQMQQEFFQSASQSLSVGAVLSYLMKLGLSQIWSAVNILQITTSLGFVKTSIPACTDELLQQIYSVVTFELLPEDVYQPFAEEILQLPSDYAFSEELANFGEDSAYILMLLFLPITTIIIFTTYYYLNLLWYKLAKWKNVCKRQRKAAQMRYMNSYGFYYRTIIEMSLEFTLLGLVEIIVRQAQQWNEKVSWFVGVFCVYNNLWFIFFSYFMTNSKEQIIKIGDSNHKLFNKQYDTLWEELKITNSSPPSFYSIFVARRFIYGSIIILGPAYYLHTVFMFGLMIYLNLTYLCYLVSVKPFEKDSMNWIEIFNEIVNYIVTCLVLNLGILPAGVQHYQHGLQINYIILSMFAVNFIFVVKTMIYEFYKSLKRKLVYCRGKKKYQKLLKDGDIIKQQEAIRMIKLIQISEQKQQESSLDLSKDESSDSDKDGSSENTSQYSGRSALEKQIIEKANQDYTKAISHLHSRASRFERQKYSISTLQKIIEEDDNNDGNSGRFKIDKKNTKYNNSFIL